MLGNPQDLMKLLVNFGEVTLVGSGVVIIGLIKKAIEEIGASKLQGLNAWLGLGLSLLGEEVSDVDIALGNESSNSPSKVILGAIKGAGFTPQENERYILAQKNYIEQGGDRGLGLLVKMGPDRGKTTSELVPRSGRLITFPWNSYQQKWPDQALITTPYQCQLNKTGFNPIWVAKIQSPELADRLNQIAEVGFCEDPDTASRYKGAPFEKLWCKLGVPLWGIRLRLRSDKGIAAEFFQTPPQKIELSELSDAALKLRAKILLALFLKLLRIQNTLRGKLAKEDLAHFSLDASFDSPRQQTLFLKALEEELAAAVEDLAAALRDTLTFLQTPGKKLPPSLSPSAEQEFAEETLSLLLAYLDIGLICLNALASANPALPQLLFGQDAEALRQREEVLRNPSQARQFLKYMLSILFNQKEIPDSQVVVLHDRVDKTLFLLKKHFVFLVLSALVQSGERFNPAELSPERLIAFLTKLNPLNVDSEVANLPIQEGNKKALLEAIQAAKEVAARPFLSLGCVFNPGFNIHNLWEIFLNY